MGTVRWVAGLQPGLGLNALLSDTWVIHKV